MGSTFGPRDSDPIDFSNGDSDRFPTPLAGGSDKDVASVAVKEDGTMALLEARGLEKWYGRRQVVNGVDFEVNEGEVVGLLGPNGAGKTTSFRMTIGLIDADGGNVFFDGQDVTNMPMY